MKSLNLEMVRKALLYKASEPEETRPILQQLKFCCTTKHGSWLNTTEIELSVLSKQCLDRHIADFQTLEQEVAA